MHLIEIEEEKELEIEEENKEEKKVKINYIVNNQLTKINDTIAKIKNQLFIALVAYDEYYKRYYLLTLILFYFSSLVTFIEALRLIIIEYVNKSDKGEQLLINVNLLSTIINVLVLYLGIMITVLTSIVRFKNYREILEKLREKQNIMIEYIDKYKKQKDNLEFLHLTKENDIEIEEIEKIKNEVAKYDTILVSTNILQFLTTTDLIRYNKYKIKFDKKLKKLKEEDEDEDEDIPSRRKIPRIGSLFR